jgi:hypothetical protein
LTEKDKEEEERAEPDRSLPTGAPLLDFFRSDLFRPIVVVGICLEKDPGGCVRIAEVLDSDREISQLSYISG